MRQDKCPKGNIKNHKTKKSVVRIVETGAIEEFDSRAKMCNFLKIKPNSLSKFMRNKKNGLITIRNKEYEVIQ